ncbi:MAG TPA: 3-oxoadipate enol-lactonase [Parvularcula sp.]|nr:3-oxoadipate enol-lactonase [Parvularcula sp.]
MPFADNAGVKLHWRADGNNDGPALVLLNSIGTDLHSWNACMPLLADYYTLVRMDARGHGRSDAPARDYDLKALASEVVAVMDAAGVARVSVAGVSLGGMIAMQLALDHPARVENLVVICSSSAMDAKAWGDRIAAVRKGGTAAIADMAMERFISHAFDEANPARVAQIRDGLVAMSKDGYAGAGAAIRDMAIANDLKRISQPLLVIAGKRDVSTPFAEHGSVIVERAPRASAVHVDAGHLAQIEAPGEVAALIREFIGRSPDR